MGKMKGSVIEIDYQKVNDDWHRVAGGYDSIRLENNENGNWLELQQATIDQYFEPTTEDE